MDKEYYQQVIDAKFKTDKNFDAYTYLNCQLVKNVYKIGYANGIESMSAPKNYIQELQELIQKYKN